MTDFSGTSILSNEFVVIGRESTDNLEVLLGLRQMWPMSPQVAKSGLKNQNLNGMILSLYLFTMGGFDDQSNSDLLLIWYAPQSS